MDETLTIYYEQPLRELVRVCVRLEHLFNQIDVYLATPNMASHTQTLIALITNVLNLLDRPDLKSKISKEFNNHIAKFSRLESLPQISQEKLQDTLKQLKHLAVHFLNMPGKIGQSLRDNEFLAAVRQNLLSPCGGNCIDSPAYFYWIHRAPEVREQQIHLWLKTFDEVRHAVRLLLDIIRHSAEPQQYIAEKGFYHKVLDHQIPYQLLRVALSTDDEVYPKISAGRHRMSIRFLVPSMTGHAIQTPKDISFQLTKCVV